MYRCVSVCLSQCSVASLKDGRLSLESFHNLFQLNFAEILSKRSDINPFRFLSPLSIEIEQSESFLSLSLSVSVFLIKKYQPGFFSSRTKNVE